MRLINRSEKTRSPPPFFFFFSGFGGQGCNRNIAFFKTAAIAQGTNIVRRELGLPETYARAADLALKTDIVPKVSDR